MTKEIQPTTPWALNPLKVHRILVCHVARIGDTILTTPPIRLLSEHFPHAKIDFLGHPKRYQVLIGLPYLHHVGAISKRRALFLGWWSKLTRRKKYDLAVIWGHDSAIGHFATRVSHCLLMQALTHQRDNDSLTHQGGCLVDIGEVPNSVSAPEQSLTSWRMTLIREGLNTMSLGISPPADYQVLPEEQTWAKTWMQSNVQSNFIVGLVVNTHPVGNIEKYPERELPISHYNSLCQRIINEAPNTHFLLLGDKYTLGKISPLKQRLGDRLHVVVNQFTLRQSSSIINELDLFIGGDTGPTHIAVALQIPTIAFFHCSRRGSQVLMPKNQDKLLVVDHPCQQESLIFSASMEDIDMDNVWNRALPFIKKITAKSYE